MVFVTLRVLDGADRGRVFENLPTPVTLGREEGNAVQLNDERISRFHVKIQDDQSKLVLTDLESTNGTQVNGEPVTLRNVRPGDLVALGRTVLLLGSAEEIAQRLAALRGVDVSGGVSPEGEVPGESLSPAFSLDKELEWDSEGSARDLLHTLLPPDLPVDLGLGQAAQLAEILQYMHLRLRHLVATVKTAKKSERVTLEQRQWQNLLDLHGLVTKYLKGIGEPEA